MRIPLLTVSVLALSIGMLCADEAALKTEHEPKAVCHGTAIEFFSSPVVAAELAAKHNKLVMVLHVSGHFEDPNFT
jgi:hypothetical protein